MSTPNLIPYVIVRSAPELVDLLARHRRAGLEYTQAYPLPRERDSVFVVSRPEAFLGVWYAFKNKTVWSGGITSSEAFLRAVVQEHLYTLTNSPAHYVSYLSEVKRLRELAARPA